MSQIKHSLQIGKSLQNFFDAALKGVSLSDENKNILLTAYFSLAREHHHSISLLIAHENFGSAFAMMRLLIEIVYRAHWALRCATQTQIDQIFRDDKFKFPRFGQMSSCIDAVYRTDHFFQNWKKNAWHPLNSYAHFGLLALGRRFFDHTVQPNYGETEIFEAVRASNASLVLLGKLFFTHFDRANDAITIESFWEPESLSKPL